MRACLEAICFGRPEPGLKGGYSPICSPPVSCATFVSALDWPLISVAQLRTIQGEALPPLEALSPLPSPPRREPFMQVPIVPNRVLVLVAPGKDESKVEATQQEDDDVFSDAVSRRTSGYTVGGYRTAASSPPTSMSLMAVAPSLAVEALLKVSAGKESSYGTLV